MKLPNEPSESPVTDGKPNVTTLIDELLAEQRQLTAVEKFGQRHDAGERPRMEQHYRDLIPLSAPRPGEQYAFEVDLDRCSGCKACVTACHSMNGLDEDESWREVGVLIGEGPARPGRWQAAAGRVIPLQLTVTTACHHCVEPGCMLGCPVLAYDKDPVTGIVRHLDDQCIGCSYCILKCPYEVPKYSAKRGIVRKCDLCQGRLAEGEAPACVQACPNEAIQVKWVSSAELKERWRGTEREKSKGSVNPWLPDSPDPAITVPSTNFITRQSGANLRSADHGSFPIQPAHWPLVWMLVLTQAAVGLLVIATLRSLLWPGGDQSWLILVAWGLLHLGLVASVFHLGRPTRAWRAFLGWRTSWMSREIIAFGTLSGAVTALAAGELAVRDGWHPLVTLQLPLLIASAVMGLIAVVSSAMIYEDTGRPCWGSFHTVFRFTGQLLLLGFAAGGGVMGLAPSAEMHGTNAVLVGTILLCLTTLIGDEIRRRGAKDPDHPAHRSEMVARKRLAKSGWSAVGLLITGSILSGLALGDFGSSRATWSVVAACVVLLASLLRQMRFFAAAAAPQMPGMP